jgi:hypothetical protein
MQFKSATGIDYVSAATPLPVVLNGVTTNSDAAAGQVGEYISASLAQASATSLTDSTPVNLTSISLTAGDWDVDGALYYNPANTTQTTLFSGGVSTTSATLPSSNGIGGKALDQIARTSTGSGPSAYAVPTTRLSLAVTTTVYLVAQANFTVSTATAFGQIRARRVR